MAKKTGLGSNLDSIFDDNELFGEQEGGTVTLKLTDIEPNKDQPRKNFDLDALNALADSIRENGLIQPLIVRQLDNGAYQLVAGERRWRASKIAGLSEVPVRIMELDDQQTAQVALIENLQREDLNPIEEAAGYRQLMLQFGLKQDEVAKKVGKSRSSVTNVLRILDLPEEVKELARRGDITRGHCKALLGVKDELKQIEFAKKAAAGGVTVRQIERAGESAQKPKRVSRKTEDSFYAEAAISLSSVLGKPCSVKSKGKKITLELTCNSREELQQLVNRLAEIGEYE